MTSNCPSLVFSNFTVKCNLSIISSKEIFPWKWKHRFVLYVCEKKWSKCHQNIRETIFWDQKIVDDGDEDGNTNNVNDRDSYEGDDDDDDEHDDTDNDNDGDDDNDADNDRMITIWNKSEPTC